MSKQTNLRLSPEAVERLERLASLYGGKSQAVERALAQLEAAPASGHPGAIAGHSEAPPVGPSDDAATLRRIADELISLRRIARFARKP